MRRRGADASFILGMSLPLKSLTDPAILRGIDVDEDNGGAEEASAAVTQ